MALSMENLCKPRSLCVLKMVTMALSFVASAFLLIAALRIAIDRCRRVAAPPIGRVVDNLVSPETVCLVQPCPTPHHVRPELPPDATIGACHVLAIRHPPSRACMQ
jgi:hypothetical protein